MKKVIYLAARVGKRASAADIIDDTVYFTGAAVLWLLCLWLLYQTLVVIGRVLFFFMEHINPVFGIIGIMAMITCRAGSPYCSHRSKD